MSLWRELNRRNVFRAGVAYLAASWLLVEVLSVVLDTYAAPAWVLQVLMAALALGLPIVLGFSWAYEITPEGLKRSHEVAVSESITRDTGRRLDRFTIALLAVAIGVVVVDRTLLAPRPGEPLAAATEQPPAPASAGAQVARPSPSIAVLPFVNMSADAEQEFFSDGITEELLNLLARIPGLQVAARTSAFAYKGKDVHIGEIGKDLGVAHVLEGSVRTSGNRVRITAQLIRADTGFHLWSETYDRTLEDVFAIQDEIAAAVVAQLRVRLLGEVPQVKQTDPRAYALYLEARHLGRLVTPENLQQSIDLFRQALNIDPEFPAAWDELATNYYNQAAYALVPMTAGLDQARDALQRALEIDPTYAPAHAGVGWVAMVEGDLPSAARHFERALQLDPKNLDILRNAATLLRGLGRWEQAIAVDRYVVERDPLNPKAWANLAADYANRGQREEAINAFETLLRLSPGQLGARYGLAMAHLGAGDAAAALATLDSEPDRAYRSKGQSMALHALGRPEESAAKLQELTDLWGDVYPSEIAEAHAFAGDPDRAFEWLDQALAQREWLMSLMLTSPFMRSLHDDPRWDAFWERAGFAPATLDAISFQVKLPDTV